MKINHWIFVLFIIGIIFISGCALDYEEEESLEEPVEVQEQVTDLVETNEVTDGNVHEEIIEEGIQEEQKTEKSILPKCDDQIFTIPIVDINSIRTILPLGAINPPRHTLPTEHMYFKLYEEVNLRAPAEVYITNVGGPLDVDAGDYSLRFALCEDVYGYFDHISSLSDEIKTMIKDTECASWNNDPTVLCDREITTKVEAGTVLGTVGPYYGGFDFGTYDYRVRLDYANPSRYSIPYFIERGEVKSWSVICPNELYDNPLRQQFYDKITDELDPKCGEVMQDLKGTLQGNWFIGKVEEDWENSIAFVHDNRNPSKILISISGGFTDPGKFEFVPKNAGFFNRKFSNVIADGNIYCYEGEDPNRIGEEKPKGKIIIKLVSDIELQIEHQSGSCSGNLKFTDKAEIYER